MSPIYNRSFVLPFK